MNVCKWSIKLYHCSQGIKKVSEEGKIGRKLSDHKLNRRSDAEWLHLKPLSEGKRRLVMQTSQQLSVQSHHCNLSSLIQTQTVQSSPVTVETTTRSLQSSRHPTLPPTRRRSHPQTPSKTKRHPPRRMVVKPSSTITDTAIRMDTVTLMEETATQTRR